MKVFDIATIVALSALINGSSALWCGCYQKGGGLFGANLWNKANSIGCCFSITGQDLQGGSSFFGLTAQDWCDVTGDEVDKYKECCTDYGYCK